MNGAIGCLLQPADLRPISGLEKRRTVVGQPLLAHHKVGTVKYSAHSRDLIHVLLLNLVALLVPFFIVLDDEHLLNHLVDFFRTYALIILRIIELLGSRSTVCSANPEP